VKGPAEPWSIFSRTFLHISTELSLLHVDSHSRLFLPPKAKWGGGGCSPSSQQSTDRMGNDPYMSVFYQILIYCIVMATISKMKAERSFDLDFIFDIETKQTCLFYELDRSKQSEVCLFHKFERTKLCIRRGLNKKLT